MQKNVNMDGAVFLKKVLPAPICTNLHVKEQRDDRRGGSSLPSVTYAFCLFQKSCSSIVGYSF